MHSSALVATLGLSVFAFASALSSPARAQAPDAASTVSTPTAAPPAVAPGTAAATTPLTVHCALGAHGGIEDADAQTAGRIVCDEIAHQGAPGGARYRVDLGKLGTVIILSVAREGEAPGTTADTREIRLQGIEEVSVAAPRIASAIVHRTAMSETETTDNLVGEETRKPKTKPGSVHFALGLVGILPPLDQSLSPSAGLLMDVHYEASRLELGGGLRFGGTQGDSTSVGFFQADVGGRYYFTDADVAPYLGGGLEWMFLSLWESNVGGGNNAGLGAFADAGVEILRTHHTHLALGARLDLPFFSMTQSRTITPPAGVATINTKTYYAPLSLEIRLTF